MTAVTDSDLKRLEDLIVNGQKAIETRLTGMETRLTGMETRWTTMETRLTGMETRLTALEVGQTEIRSEIKALDLGQQALALGQSEIKGEIKAVNTRIDGMSERIKPIDKIPDLAERVGEFKIWRQIVIIAFTALFSGVVTWSVRAGYINP